jgi:AhpD family alkylhydroperoxidase
MARISLKTRREVGPLTRLAYRFAERQYGRLPEPLQAAAHHPGLMWATAVHELAYARAARVLDPALRDLVVHRVATVVGCSWCVDFGTMMAIKSGFSVERHRELGRYAESGAFTDDEKAALEYADAMTAQPMTVTDKLVDRVRERLGEAGLVELTYSVALENFRARTNHALGLTAQGYTSGDACPLPFADQIREAAGGPASTGL